jgi:hypothetical protein
LRVTSRGLGDVYKRQRNHFGDSLPTHTAIERIPHTTIWATEEGVLLWDWRNGYADLSPEQDNTEQLLAECLKFLTEQAYILKSKEKYRLMAKLKIHLRR